MQIFKLIFLQCILQAAVDFAVLRKAELEAWSEWSAAMAVWRGGWRACQEGVLTNLSHRSQYHPMAIHRQRMLTTLNRPIKNIRHLKSPHMSLLSFVQLVR